jgi:hypothetical protein
MNIHPSGLIGRWEPALRRLAQSTMGAKSLGTDSTDEPERLPDSEPVTDTRQSDAGSAEPSSPDEGPEAPSPAAPGEAENDAEPRGDSVSGTAKIDIMPSVDSASDRIRKTVRREPTFPLLKILAIGSWIIGITGVAAIAMSLDADSLDVQFSGVFFAVACLLMGGVCALEGIIGARLRQVAKVVPHAVAGLLANGLLLVLVVAACGQIVETTFRMATVSEQKRLEEQQQQIRRLELRRAGLERELAKFRAASD